MECVQKLREVWLDQNSVVSILRDVNGERFTCSHIERRRQLHLEL